MGLTARQRAQAEAHAAKLFKILGVDTEALDDMRETPSRYVRAFEELLSGWGSDTPFTFKTFPSKNDQIVLGRNITYASLCPHHFLPFFGNVHIGYLPDARVVGLSKLPRLVRWCAARPQMQEDLAGMIADEMMSRISPHAVVVIVTGIHTCCRIRGVRDPEMDVVSSAIRGDDRFHIKDEVLSMLGISGGYSGV